ncbi:MAG: hypothetical protein GY832_17990 [Chloroflexi bacterium]|nr:hypothetical protein [Chloroflexota bacterium]
MKEESEQVTRLLAELVDRTPDDPQVQNLIARHYAVTEQFYPVSA